MVQQEQTREEMSRKGGEAVSQDREHMAEIGKKGGESRGGNQQQNFQGQDQNNTGRGSNLTDEDRSKGGQESHRKAG